METCKICGEQFKNLKALSTHFNLKHNINAKDYYDKYLLKEGEGKCTVCGNKTTYRNLGTGYLKTCSLECSCLDKDNRKKRSEYKKNKKQKKGTIDKRIQNTNQYMKELSRKKTMISKYGVDNPMKLNEIKNKVSDKLSGVKRERTDEWQKNIIESKRRNGTLKHSDETKAKITNSLNEHHKLNLDREKYITTSNSVRHLNGWYNGLYFRSSLELSFLVNNTEVSFTSCELKKYSVNYLVNGKYKVYYPDYTDGNFIYEIKPTKLLNFGLNPLKISAAKEKFGYVYNIITEKECNYITKDTIKKLIELGSVILVKNSEKIFERYKN